MIIPEILLIIFAIHAIAFSIVYLKRRVGYALVLVVAFLCLSVYYLLVILESPLVWLSHLRWTGIIIAALGLLLFIRVYWRAWKTKLMMNRVVMSLFLRAMLAYVKWKDRPWKLALRIFLFGLLGLLLLFGIFVGYHYVRYLQATARMEELSVDLERRIVEWEKKEFRRPPITEPAIQGNAATFYQEAEALMTPRDNLGLVDELWIARDHPDKPVSQKAIDYYNQNKSIIDYIISGTNTAYYKSLLNLREGINVEKPGIMINCDLARLMALQGRELEKDGHFTEAIELYARMLRCGDDYSYNGNLLSAVIGKTNYDSYGNEEIKRLLLENKLSETGLTKLIRYLKILLDSRPSLSEALEGDQLCAESSIKRYAKDNGFIPHPINLWDAHGNYWFNRVDYLNIWEDDIMVLSEIKLINSLPYTQHKNKIERLRVLARSGKNQITITKVENILSCINCDLDLLSYRRGSYILVALKLYQTRHGAYPDKLEALSPEIIPSLPLDPFSDKPFIYHLKADGTIALYSVGPNMKDDGGVKQDKADDIVIAP